MATRLKIPSLISRNFDTINGTGCELRAGFSGGIYFTKSPLKSDQLRRDLHQSTQTYHVRLDRAQNRGGDSNTQAPRSLTDHSHDCSSQTAREPAVKATYIRRNRLARSTWRKEAGALDRPSSPDSTLFFTRGLWTKLHFFLLDKTLPAMSLHPVFRYANAPPSGLF